jgi:CheY-like chemotaxis protein
MSLSNPESKVELRNGETIRAYLDELARLKTPIQLWKPGTDEIPFETTLQAVTAITFSTTTTPQLEQGELLSLAFMLDARRFLAQVKVVSSGVFRIPISIAQGERRAEFRGGFDRAEPGQVLVVEQCSETVFGGRTLQGKLLDLSRHGLRVALDQVGALSGRGEKLKVGDRFAVLCLSSLPFTPQIVCRGSVAHISRNSAEPHLGFLLDGLSESDQKNIERILSPRYPTTFGEAFPNRKRKTDLADRVGTPTPTLVKAKAPEIVERNQAATPPASRRPPATAVMRLRKAGKKILLLSEHAATPALAEALREDGFKQVVEARSYLEARTVASQARFDLLILDIRVGTHWCGDLMGSLHANDLLLETPIILLADYRNDGSLAMARNLDAVLLHERKKPYDDLAPVIYKLLLDN